jgi:hypothetical protein
MVNIKIDKMQYQKNKISYSFGLFALIFNVIYVLRAINILTPSLSVAIKIILNILLLLLTFLSMEKSKVYSKSFSIILVACGFISLLRILYVPMQVVTGQILQKSGEVYPTSEFIILVLYLVLLSASYFISGICGIVKNKQLTAYLKSKEESLEVESNE